MDRREFLKICSSVVAVGALAGCTGKNPELSYNKNRIDEDILSGGPFSTRKNERIVQRFNPSTRPQRNEITFKHQDFTPVAPQSSLQHSNQIIAYSREKWHARPTINSRLKPMNGVNRITVHHEGNPKPNYSYKPKDVIRELRKIQKVHFKVLGGGDIAYHFIIDRSGRIWQGRDICYQGAHAKSNNSHNIGIMCLGNFNIQKPSNEQVVTLEKLCNGLLRGYNIPASRLYGHRELRSTACPGANLFPHVKRIRAIYS